MPTPLPGCPRCHRNDRVQVLEPGDEVAARSRIYEAPNHHCLYCAELFEYDAKEGKYAPFRIRTVVGEITNTVFEPALGPGDAAFAWKSAERRMSEARAADPGVKPFDTFGGLKRATT